MQIREAQAAVVLTSLASAAGSATMWIERVPELAAEQVQLPVEGAALLR